MNRKYLIIVIFSLFSFYGCIDNNNKSTTYQGINIKFIVDNINDSAIPSEIITLIKPFSSVSCNGANLIGYDGYIHFVNINNDSASNVDLKANESFFDKHWLGEPSVSKKSEEIDGYFSAVKVPASLIQKPGAGNDKVTGNIQKYIKLHIDYTPFVLIKPGGSNSYPEAASYSNIDSLKSAIATSCCKNKTKNVIVIIQSGNGAATSSPDNLTQLLTKIGDSGAADSTRMKGVDEAMNTYFTPDFVVIMHDGNAEANPRIWENKGEGKKYLERLATDVSLTGIKIISAEKSNKDNKISKIELVEIHQEVSAK